MSDREPSEQELYKALFAHLIAMLATSVMQQLGKLVNPVTGKTEVSLEGAQMTIDMMDMLEAKTRGNLDREEERMLREALASVKMNFVEARNASPRSEAEETKLAEPPPPPLGTKPDAKDAKEPKFHKKYE